MTIIQFPNSAVHEVVPVLIDERIKAKIDSIKS
jgi:hypothetical protein